MIHLVLYILLAVAPPKYTLPYTVDEPMDQPAPVLVTPVELNP